MKHFIIKAVLFRSITKILKLEKKNSPLYILRLPLSLLNFYSYPWRQQRYLHSTGDTPGTQAGLEGQGRSWRDCWLLGLTAARELVTLASCSTPQCPPFPHPRLQLQLAVWASRPCLAWQWAERLLDSPGSSWPVDLRENEARAVCKDLICNEWDQIDLL